MEKVWEREEWTTEDGVEDEYYYNDNCVEGLFTQCDDEDFTLLIDDKQRVILDFFMGNQKCVTVPEDVEIIADNVFCDCKEIEILNLPKSLKAVGCEALLAPSLKRISYAGTPEDWCRIEFCSAPFESGCEFYIDGKKVNRISIDKKEKVPAFAFAGLKGLSEIRIGGGVKEVGNSSFEYCEGVQKIILSKDVVKVCDGAFDGCNPKEGFEIDVENDIYTVIGDCIVEKATETVVAGCDKSIVADGIKIIGNYAFADCSFDSIDLPASLKVIKDGAFSGTNIKRLILPDGLEKLGDNVFEYCKELVSVTIPSSVKELGKGLFVGCELLSSIRVERGNRIYESGGNCIIEKATGRLIAGCNESEIPSHVTEIADFAFYDCKKLISLRLPRGLKKIGSNAFAHIGVEEAVFPAELTEIGYFAFFGCPDLKSLVFEGEISFEAENVFYNCPNIEFITAPKRYKKNYKELVKNFKKICDKLPKLKFVK